VASNAPGGNVGLTLEQRLTPAPADRFALKDSIFQGLRVALPAVVKAFRTGPPAVVDIVAASKELFQLNTGSDSAVSLQTVSVNLPLIQDVPVLVPSAGGWSLTFPIKAGDECLIVFSDTALDAWLQNGGVDNEPISCRRHDLSDAVAIFGLRSTPRGLPSYSTSSAQLRNDDASVVIDLAPAGITITAPAVTVNCSGAANVNAASSTVTTSGKTTVSAEEVDITGSSIIKIAASGNTKIEGLTFMDHTHILTSTSQTGPVFTV
jgi:phage baseplate assembly protein gpV